MKEKTYTKQVKERDRKKHVSVSLSDNEVNKARREAKKQNISLSSYIAFLIKGA